MNLSQNGRDLALFAYLCVTQQPQSRSLLADLLWTDQSEQEAKSNLRYLLHSLKKVCGDYLIVERESAGFNQQLPHWVDVTIFKTQLIPSVAPDRQQSEPALLQGVLELYAGEFLTGLQIQDAPNFERWLLDQRRDLHDLLVYGIQLSAQQHLELGEYEAGLALNHYLLTLEPWREEAHRQRMLLLAASGQRSAALMQYDICCQTLEKELDAPPMNETNSLYLQIKSGQWFLGKKTIERHRDQRVAVRSYPLASTLPESTTTRPPVAERFSTAMQVDWGAMPGTDHFVGRQCEQAMLRQSMGNEHCQLIALLGLGGQGKSALAARFVQEQVALFQEHQRSTSNPPIQAVIWRSLAGRPSCIEILRGWLYQLTHQPYGDLSTNFDQLVTTLFAVLEEKRCLFVLDGVDSVLQNPDRAGQAEAEIFESLFQLFIKRSHRSYLLLTSRIRPAALTHLEQNNQRIYCLEVSGLNAEESAALLADHGIETNPSNYLQLHEYYAGHPQLLSQAAELTHALFADDADAFLQEKRFFLAEMGAPLAEQFTRLSPLERQIIQMLAEAGDGLNHPQIWSQLAHTATKQEYYQALRSLQRTYFIQHTAGQFHLANVIATYLVEEAFQ